jgi:hypothetical protein
MLADCGPMMRKPEVIEPDFQFLGRAHRKGGFVAFPTLTPADGSTYVG